jgi:dihydrodipicolinate reductase
MFVTLLQEIVHLCKNWRLTVSEVHHVAKFTHNVLSGTALNP